MGRIVFEVPERIKDRGAALPITKHGGQYWRSKGVLDVIWSSIIHILGTRIGRRIMLPEFGSRIPELVFEQNDSHIEALARHYTVDAIARWEKRVQIVDVFVKARENEFEIGMTFVVSGNDSGPISGTLIVYRNQDFKIAQQFWGQTA